MKERKRSQSSLEQDAPSRSALSVVISSHIPTNRRNLPPLSSSTAKPSKIPIPTAASTSHRSVTLL